MTNLIGLQFRENQVRIVNINGDVWFVGKDVCDVLEITNNRNAYSRLKEYEKNTVQIMDGNQGNPSMTVISESGLYRLVLTSRKPQAEPFQDWVCQEVIPQIRKHGTYQISTQTQPQLPPHKEAEQVADSIAHIQDVLGNQPRLAQFLTDQALNTFEVAKHQLMGVPLRGVAEIAEEMGLPISYHNRSQLGKFVKSQCGEIARVEERLCNGTMRKIYCYPDCDQVRDAIDSFFNK